MPVEMISPEDIIKYEIIKNDNLNNLMIKIQNKMDLFNYEPIGGLINYEVDNTNFFAQAMILRRARDLNRNKDYVCLKNYIKN